jgi:type I restriction enzyme S subunit
MNLTKIGEFLNRSKIPIDIQDNLQYNRVTIRINHNGVSLRDSEIGKKIGTKKQFILKAGQFIVSKIDARYGAFGIAPEEVEGAIITGNFWAYDVDEKKVNIEWFNQFTNSPDFYDICERASSGITHRKYLDEKFFLNYEILLPSVDEQLVQIKKINKQKKSFGNLTVELTHQLSLVKKLRQQLLQDAVQGKLVPQNQNDEPASELLKKIKAEKAKLIAEKKLKKDPSTSLRAGKELPPIKPEEIPFEIPENWVWCRLGEIIYYTEGGKSPNCLHEPAKDNEWGVIKTTAVQEMYFLENENKVLPRNFIVSEQHKVLEGDILITRAGPKNRVGIVCCVEKLSKKLILSDKTIRIEHPKQLLYSKYIALALNSTMIKPYIEQKMTGMADSQVNISQDNMKGFPIPLPPLTEQNIIIQKLDELMQYCNELEASIKQSETQNEKLLQQVLREALSLPRDNRGKEPIVA